MTEILCASETESMAPLFLLAAATHGTLDKTVTMYHVNPIRFGPIPRDTNTADVTGDLFFELFEVLSIPLACSDPTVPPDRKPFECRNLESNDPSDVVNKITLNLDSHFSGYAMCNIGNKDGKDPLGRPCPVGGYCCYCSESVHGGYPHTAPCNATVGHENLQMHFGQTSSMRRPCFKDYDCWTEHAGAKLSTEHPGAWYSPLKIGDCTLHNPSGPNCTWTVKSVDKIVNSTCHSNSFFGAVQRAAPDLFTNCTGGGTSTPNASDPCWIRGFYTAVLGPDADKTIFWKVAGLPLDDLIAFWTAPFESDDPAKGGCPGLPVPPRSAWPRYGELAQQQPPTRRQRLWREFTRKWYGQPKMGAISSE